MNISIAACVWSSTPTPEYCLATIVIAMTVSGDCVWHPREIWYVCVCANTIITVLAMALLLSVGCQHDCYPLSDMSAGMANTEGERG